MKDDTREVCFLSFSLLFRMTSGQFLRDSTGIKERHSFHLLLTPFSTLAIISTAYNILRPSL